jgi:hypothetical protein
MSRNLQRTSAGWLFAIQPPWGYGVLVIDRKIKITKEKKRNGKGRGESKDTGLTGVLIQLELGKEARPYCPLCHCSEPSRCRCQFFVVLTPCFYKELFTS